MNDHTKNLLRTGYAKERNRARTVKKILAQIQGSY